MLNNNIILPDDFTVPKALFMQDFLEQTMGDRDDGGGLHLYRYAEIEGDEHAQPSKYIEFWMFQGNIVPKKEAAEIKFTRLDWRGGYHTYNGQEFTNPPNTFFKKYINEIPGTPTKWEVSAGRLGGDIWDVATSGEEVLSIEKSDWGWIV